MRSSGMFRSRSNISWNKSSKFDMPTNLYAIAFNDLLLAMDVIASFLVTFQI